MKLKLKDLGYFDNLPGMITLNNGEAKFKEFYKGLLLDDIDNMIERYKFLDTIATVESRNKRYKEYLKETRNLYIFGQYISCIIMAGATAERIMKDIYTDSIRIYKNKKYNKPKDDVTAQLERFIERDIVITLWKAGLIETEVKSAAEKLGDLRNDYAHGKENIDELRLENKAKDAIMKLKIIIDNTVSVYKVYEK